MTISQLCSRATMETRGQDFLFGTKLTKENQWEAEKIVAHDWHGLIFLLLLGMGCQQWQQRCTVYICCQVNTGEKNSISCAELDVCSCIDKILVHESWARLQRPVGMTPSYSPPSRVSGGSQSRIFNFCSLFDFLDNVVFPCCQYGIILN